MATEISKKPPKSTPPANTFDMLQRQIDRLFEDFSRDWHWPALPSLSAWDVLPAMEVHHGKNQVDVSIELPGVDEKGVNIEVTGDTVAVSGEKTSETKRENGERFVTERSYGSFHRSISLPFDIDPDLVEARYDQGVLKIKIGKPEHVKEASRKIAIKH